MSGKILRKQGNLQHSKGTRLGPLKLKRKHRLFESPKARKKLKNKCECITNFTEVFITKPLQYPNSKNIYIKFQKKLKLKNNGFFNFLKTHPIL